MTEEKTKTIAEVAEELKDELKEFAGTRLLMLRSELEEKLRSFKLAAPVLGIGALLLGTGWLLLSGFLVCIVAEAFGTNLWSFVVSFLIVGGAYAILGGTAAFLAWQQLKEKGVKPERTIQVLKQDRIWMQTEAKTRL